MPFQKKCSLLFQGKRGCMLALNTRTGKIIAVVNPKCVFGESYPPGSVFKLVTAAAGLSEGIIDGSHTEVCRGKVKINGKTFKCWRKSGHGKLSLNEALAKSCNIYFYKVGAKIPSFIIKKYAMLFGFGKKTGNIYVDENTGELPASFLPQENISFAAGEHPHLRVTPAQLAVFISIVANGGTQVDGSVLAYLRRAMAESVLYGTSMALSSLKKPIAGKTGTARHLQGFRAHAWFAGFYPLENPEIVLVIFVFQGEGRKDAIPIAKEIFKAYFKSYEKNN